MPNWMDMLNAAGRPLLPRGAIQGLQEALVPGGSEPLPEEEHEMMEAGFGLPGGTFEALGAIPEVAGHLYNHPMETLGGAGAGALEGLRSLTSPASLVGLLGGVAGKAAGLGGRALGMSDDVARVAGPTLDVLDDVPVPQRMPSMGDVDDILGDSQRLMARTPSATGRFRHPSGAALEGAAGRTSVPTGSGLPAEFVPRGGEAAFNASRPKAAGPALNFPPPSPYRRPGR